MNSYTLFEIKSDFYSFFEKMLDKLQRIIEKYESLREEALKPEIFQDMEKSKTINKELASLEDTYNIAVSYKKVLESQTATEELLKTESDPDLLAMAQEEFDQNKQEIERLDKELTIALLPKDPNDDKNIFLEIRPAA